MRALTPLLIALGLLVAIAGTSFANCGADHTDTAQPTTSRPLPQS